MKTSTGHEKKKRIWKIGDAFLILVIILAATASILWLTRARSEEKGVKVVVEARGKEVESIAIEDGAARAFDAEGLHGISKYEIEDGKVRMVSSPCRDKLCERTGWIDSVGQMIVCLPNQVVIRIEGEKEKGIDTVSH